MKNWIVQGPDGAFLTRSEFGYAHADATIFPFTPYACFAERMSKWLATHLAHFYRGTAWQVLEGPSAPTTYAFEPMADFLDRVA